MSTLLKLLKAALRAQWVLLLTRRVRQSAMTVALENINRQVVGQAVMIALVERLLAFLECRHVQIVKKGKYMS